MTNMPILTLTPTTQVISDDAQPARGLLADRLQRRLSRAPRICVMGEFNSGKSALINVLLGASVVPTSIAANTRLPIRMYYSLKPSLEVELADRTRVAITPNRLDPATGTDAAMLHVGLPINRLKNFDLIDTPGLQSGDSDKCKRALATCRGSHLAIWCTTATQAWKATEASAWRALPPRVRARSILAVTFKDIIPGGGDESRLWGRINAEAAPHFDQVAMVSSRDALAARAHADANQRDKLWHLSGAAELLSALDKAVSAIVEERQRGAQTRLDKAAAAA